MARKVRAAAGDRRVGHGNVQPAEVPKRTVDKGVDGIRCADVDLDNDRPASQGFDVGTHRIDIVTVG